MRNHSVEFDTREFEYAHGKMPRGRGGWGFIAHEKSKRDDYFDHIFWFNGLYADAKKAARAHFAGVTARVIVCT